MFPTILSKSTKWVLSTAERSANKSCTNLLVVLVIVMKGEPCKTAMQGGEFLFEQIFCFQKAFEFFFFY